MTQDEAPHARASSLVSANATDDEALRVSRTSQAASRGEVRGVDRLDEARMTR